MFRVLASVIWLTLLVRRLPSLVARLRSRRSDVPGATPSRWFAPRVPREARKLLAGVQPPAQAEIELFVDGPYRSLGPDWIFTRGKVLTFSERRKTRVVGSVAGFDVAQEFAEEYSVYRGVYGYNDDRGRLHTFAMPPTENDRAVRPGRSFIILFNRRSPREHHLFTVQRGSHPAKEPLQR